MGEVVGGQNQLDPWHGSDVGEIADREAGMSMRRPQKTRYKAIRRESVGRVSASSGYEFRILDPLDRLPDPKLHRLHIVPQLLKARCATKCR
jgi:hypothetical protein